MVLSFASLVWAANRLGEGSMRAIDWRRAVIEISRYLGAVVSVVVFWPPPSTLTLSSRPWKISASPVTLPRAESMIFGGVEAVPVRTYSFVAPV